MRVLFPLCLLCFFVLNLSAQEELEFPNDLCGIKLPASSTWKRLSPDQISNPENILVVMSSDGKIACGITVQKINPETDQDKREYLNGRIFGLNEQKQTVGDITQRDFGKNTGFMVTSKGVINGVNTVQVSWIIFANERVYSVTTSLLGPKFAEADAKRAADFLLDFKLAHSKK